MATLSYYCATYPMQDPKHGVGCNGCTCGCHMSGQEHDEKEKEVPAPHKTRKIRPGKPPVRVKRDRFGGR